MPFIGSVQFWVVMHSEIPMTAWRLAMCPVRRFDLPEKVKDNN